jgi:lipopolysaccharide/colanic/teichoic acid biosynthesis glycosyltransferase
MKRSFDILLSLLGLILSLPFLITIAILIKTNLKDSVIFKQKRAGKNNKIFYIYKFKTMKNIKDKNGNLLPDEERLTKIGRFLRKISLDELPELLNALKFSNLPPIDIISGTPNRFGHFWHAATVLRVEQSIDNGFL